MNTVMGNRQSTFAVILSVIAGAIVLLCITVADTQKVYAELQEYEVKAAFLFNFAKFVDWPEGSFKNSEAPIIISILGKDPFGGALEALKEKTINSRGIVVKRAPSPEHLERSHILFVSKSERDNLPKILEVAQKWNALTVGDMKGFAESGGIINLVKTDEKIRFEINLSATEKANLKVSSKLLKLGSIVHAK
jgi:hypothetical protein